MAETLQKNVAGQNPEQDLLLLCKFTRNAPEGASSLANLLHRPLTKLCLHAYTFDINGEAELHSKSKNSVLAIMKGALYRAADANVDGLGHTGRLHQQIDTSCTTVLTQMGRGLQDGTLSQDTSLVWKGGAKEGKGCIGPLLKQILIRHAPQQGENAPSEMTADLLQGVELSAANLDQARLCNRLTREQRVLLYLLSLDGAVMSPDHLQDVPQRQLIKNEPKARSRKSKSSCENEASNVVPSSSVCVLSTAPPVSQTSMHGNTRTMLPGSK